MYQRKYDQIEALILSESQKYSHQNTTIDARFIRKHLKEMFKYWHGVYSRFLLYFKKLQRMSDESSALKGAPANKINMSGTFGNEDALIEVFKRFVFVEDADFIGMFKSRYESDGEVASIVELGRCLLCMALFYDVWHAEVSRTINDGDKTLFIPVPLFLLMSGISCRLSELAFLLLGGKERVIEKSRIRRAKLKTDKTRTDAVRNAVYEFIRSKEPEWFREDGRLRLQEDVARAIRNNKKIKHTTKTITTYVRKCIEDGEFKDIPGLEDVLREIY